MLSLHLAWRFLREGRTQSILILAGVTIGIAAFVFVSAIVEGLQQNLLDKTLGTQAHIIVEQDEPPPRPLMESTEAAFARRIEPAEPRRRPFDQWQRALRRIESTEGVVAVCPKVAGAVLVQRGATQRGGLILGADATRLRKIVDFTENMVAGEYRLGSGDAVIGDKMAEELGVGLGDPIRAISDDREATLHVVGIFHLGASAADDGWVVTSLRNAQVLLDRVGDLTAIDVRVSDPYDAEEIGQRLAERTGLAPESWMSRNQELLTAIRAQNSSTVMIRVFVLLAVAMGIASVLVVSVVQRRGQIGILRAVGTSQRTVQAVFLWQGVLLGSVGAVLGTSLGTIMAAALETIALFEINVTLELSFVALGISVFTGVAAAILPARRAARMDPAAAIRGDG